jgi:hypothetical protein
MFSLDAVLESRYVLHKIRGFAAIHFISTLATRVRARHTLWLKSMPTLLDFLLKLLFVEHISSVRLCHLSSLPQLLGGDEMFSSHRRGYSPSISVVIRRLRSKPPSQGSMSAIGMLRQLTPSFDKRPNQGSANENASLLAAIASFR